MFFGRTQKFDDATKDKFIRANADFLKAQALMAAGHSMEDASGSINRKALGYIYGWIDAALTSIGQNMSDPSVGIPVVYQVLRNIFPGKEEKYTSFLIGHVGNDKVLLLGMMKGGQQHQDYKKAEAKGVPMGFARYLIEGETTE